MLNLKKTKQKNRKQTNKAKLPSFQPQAIFPHSSFEMCADPDSEALSVGCAYKTGPPTSTQEDPGCDE